MTVSDRAPNREQLGFLVLLIGTLASTGWGFVLLGLS